MNMNALYHNMKRLHQRMESLITKHNHTPLKHSSGNKSEKVAASSQPTAKGDRERERKCFTKCFPLNFHCMNHKREDLDGSTELVGEIFYT